MVTDVVATLLPGIPGRAVNAFRRWRQFRKATKAGRKVRKAAKRVRKQARKTEKRARRHKV